MNSKLFHFLNSQVPEIDHEVLTRFASRWNIYKSLKRGDFLFERGKIDTNLYYIQNGAVKICYEINDKEVILEFGYTGLCIFDLPTFFTGLSSGFYMEAIRNTELFGIKKSEYYNFIETNEIFAKYWRNSIERMLLNFVEREIDILTTSPQVKLTRLLQRNPQLFQHIPKKYIAVYLGISPETLSRHVIS